jgi:hypothetical protein
MKKSLIVSSYCSITAQEVRLNDNVIHRGSSEDFRDLSNDIYTKFSVDYPKFHKMDNLCKLGFLSVELLLRHKDPDQEYRGDETGVIFMNSASSLDTDRRHQDTLSDREHYFPSPSIFVYTLPNVVIGEICIRHKIYGEGNFFIAEKFDTDFIVGYIKELFNSNAIQRCIAGWVEFDGKDFESLVLLIEKQDKTETGNINFEPGVIRNIYENLK